MISVVLATYNGQKYVKEQLLSIINQTIAPDEIIICDDCSTDNTLSIIDTVKAECSILIKIYKNAKNLGYIKNFRKAIELSKGDYVFLCDQDDIWEKNKIQIIISQMQAHDSLLCCTGCQFIDKFGVNIDKIPTNLNIKGYSNWSNRVSFVSFKTIIWGNKFPGCTYCCKRELCDVFLKINSDLMPHDYQLLLLASNFNKAIYIDTPLTKYRLHDTQTIGITNKRNSNSHYLLSRNYTFLLDANKHIKIHHLIYAFFVCFFRLPFFLDLIRR